MSFRLYGTISGCGRSAGVVIPALGSGRYSPGPNIVLPSWLKGSDPHCTINVFWGQPGALATVSFFLNFHPLTVILLCVLSSPEKLCLLLPLRAEFPLRNGHTSFFLRVLSGKTRCKRLHRVFRVYASS